MSASDDASADFDKLFPILFFIFMIFVCSRIWSATASGMPPGHARGGRTVFVPYGGSCMGFRRWRWLWRWRLWWRLFRRRRFVGRRRRVGEAGNGFHPRGSRCSLSRYPRRGATNLRADRLRAGSFILELCYIPILWASVLALFMPWPLIYFTQWSVQRIFLLQLVAFIVAGLIISYMPLRLALVPRAVRRARAHRAAARAVRRARHQPHQESLAAC